MALIMCLGLFAGCGNKDKDEDITSKDPGTEDVTKDDEEKDKDEDEKKDDDEPKSIEDILQGHYKAHR